MSTPGRSAASRCYIQVPLSDSVETWSDAAFFEELKCRLPADVAAAMITGPSIEKSIAPLRSHVAEPMRWGNLFLAGDDSGLTSYSQRALARVWKGQRFSWCMTILLHRFPDGSPFDQQLQETDLAYLFAPRAAQQPLVENYVGLAS